MKNTETPEKLNLDFLKAEFKKNCMSPKNNACSFINEINIEKNDVLLKNVQDKIIKSKEYQEKICSECIWSRKKS